MKLGRFPLHLAFGILILVGFAGATVTAAGTTKAKTDTVSQKSGGGTVQGYAADSVLQNGTIVQLSGKTASKVEPASRADLQQMYGVTVDHTRCR